MFNDTLTTIFSTLVVGPTITVLPQNLSVVPGAQTTFTVSATGPVPLQYQWMFNQANIVGATATSYTLSNVDLTITGGYSVAVSFGGGTKLSQTVFLSVVAPLTNAPGCVLAPGGLVNWWPADGNANDIFGANNGTPCNGFAYAAGEQGLAFHFDGSTSYLMVGAPSLALPWTACLWVNRQNAPTGGAALAGDGLYELKLEQWNGTRQVGFTQLGVGDYSFGYIVPAGVWTHLVFVGTSTGTSLYVNGALQATLPQTLPLPRALIGAGYSTSSGMYVDYMLGSLDEILLFNRALSAEEINGIYSAGSAGLVRAPEFIGITPTGNAQLTSNLRGQTGKDFSLYTSPDLVNWVYLGGAPNPSGIIQFLDNSASHPPGFYRASQP